MILIKPKDKDARKKYKLCDNMVKQAAFAAAMGIGGGDRGDSSRGAGGAGGVGGAGVASAIDPSTITVDASYDGPRLAEIDTAAAAEAGGDDGEAALAPGAGGRPVRP